MANKSVNIQARIDQVAKEVANGKDRAYIIAKYAKKWQIQPRTFDRYIQLAKDDAGKKTALKKKAEEEALYESTKENEKKRILNSTERLEFLTKIILGEIKIPDEDVRWNPSTKRFNKIKKVMLPGHQARVNAVAEMNKMEGSYAPIKKELSGKVKTENVTYTTEMTPDEMRDIAKHLEDEY